MLAFASAMSTHTERRKKRRSRPPSLVYVELESGNGGMMRDLNESGFAVRAMMPLHAGEKTQFAFSLDARTHISGDGRIVWVEEDGRVAGLEFLGLTATSRREILAWLAAPEETTKGSIPAPQRVVDMPSPEEVRSVIRGDHAREDVPQTQPQDVPSPPPSDQAGAAAASSPPAEPAELPSADRSGHPEGEPPVEMVLIYPDAQPPAEPLTHAPASTPHNTSAPRPYAQKEAPLLEPLPSLDNIPGAATKGSATVGFTLSRAIGVMLLLMLIAGAVVFHRPVGHALIWIGGKIAGSEEPAAPRTSTDPVATPAVPSSSTAASAETTPPLAKHPEQTANPEPVTKGESRGSAVPSATQVTPRPLGKITTPPPLSSMPQVNRTMAPTASTQSPADTGAAEFAQVQEILQDKTRAAEIPEAVRLLWVALQKGNGGAELALGDLYWHGQGVARNCEQARILLSAAARKGNAEALNHLQQFRREGCP